MKTVIGYLCHFKLNRLIGCAVGLVACCMLGGCATLMPETVVPPTVVAQPTYSPLDYYAWAKTASDSDLAVELYGLEILNSPADPVINAVRTAVILGTSTRADNNTELKALELVNDVSEMETADDSGKSYKTFAAILQPLLQQRQDLHKAAASNQLGLREIDSLKRRNRQLQQQIEELTSIEQQIIEREQRNVIEP